uniref:Reverse transcriptase Ty1/copia-type domain-containing protein n=1 Tax=Fagus sylvatica TaxID=28930 RepID=A0A2N9E267_FAGSY
MGTTMSCGHHLWHYVTGEIQAPVRSKDEDDTKFTDRLEDWDCKNHHIITWFRHSTDQLEPSAHIVKDPADVTILATKQDQFCLIQFLMALTSKFELVRAALLQQDPRTNQVLGTGRRVRQMLELTSFHLPSTLTHPPSHVAHTASVFPLSLWHLCLSHVPFYILPIPPADSPVFPLAPPPVVDPVLDQTPDLPLATPLAPPLVVDPVLIILLTFLLLLLLLTLRFLPKNLHRPWILSLIRLLPSPFVNLTRHLQVIQTVLTRFAFFVALFMVLSKLLEPDLPSLAVLCISLASRPTLFICCFDKGMIILLLYVDDMIITRDDHSGIYDFKQFLHLQFEMKDLGHLSYFLDLEVSSDSTGYYLSQAKYVFDLLSRAGLTDTKVVSTPLEMNARLTPLDGTPLSDATLYRQLVGSLVYLTVTCSDIAHVVHLKQHIVSRSSTKAEYRAMTDNTSELLALCWLLKDMGLTHSLPTVIHCDNCSAIQIAHNDVFHERTDHIEINCHLVRHHLSTGILRLLPVSFSDQIVDIFTKTFSPSRFRDLISKLKMTSIRPP